MVKDSDFVESAVERKSIFDRKLAFVSSLLPNKTICPKASEESRARR